MNIKNYQKAEELFRQAIKLKPNFANAHYHLALVLKEQKKYQEAYQELETTSALLDPQSEGAKRIKQELTNLEKYKTDKESSPSALPKPNTTTKPQELKMYESSPSALETIPSPEPL